MSFRRLLNPFATSQFSFQTQLTPDECAERLGEKTLGWFQLRGLFGPNAAPLTGRVTRSGFKVRRRTSFPRNSYQPVATGSWSEHEGGTLVSVRLREDATVAWLSVAWLGVALAVALMFLMSAASGRTSQSLSGVSVLMMVLLPVVGLGAQMYARWLTREEPALMSALLRETLPASELTVPAPPVETESDTPRRAAVAA